MRRPDPGLRILAMLQAVSARVEALGGPVDLDGRQAAVVAAELAAVTDVLTDVLTTAGSRCCR